MSQGASYIIPIIGAPEEGHSPGYENILRKPGSKEVASISVEDLSKKLEALTSIVDSEALSKEKKSGLQLSEIVLRMELTASGEIGFIVGGAEASALASIELIFKR